MKFDDILDISSDNFTVNDSITINNIVYKLHESTSCPFHEILNHNRSAYLIYVTEDSEIPDSMERILGMRWSFNGNNVTLSKVKYLKGCFEQIVEEQNEIGLEEPVILLNFNSNKPIPSKIDTGADLCCLHATDISSDGGTVTFTFNGSKYSMKQADTVKILRAGDEQTRYCVNFDMVIGDKKVSNIKCTLADRSGLDSSLLIGKNLLIPSGITINPSVSETIVKIDYEYLSEVMKDE